MQTLFSKNASSGRLSPRTFMFRWVITFGGYLGAAVLSLSFGEGGPVAMPVYLAAGVGTALVLIWGIGMSTAIFLAAFTFVVFIPNDLIESHRILLAAFMALGASLQAIAAKLLVVSVGVWPTRLEHAKPIVVFLFVLGPLASLVSASIAMVALYSYELLPLSLLVSEWLTWWRADTLGVLLCTPLVIAFIASPRKEWESRLIGIVMASGFALLCVHFIWRVVQQNDIERMQNQFSRTADQRMELIRSRAAEMEGVLHSATQILKLKPEISREEFRQFSLYPLNAVGGIQAVGVIHILPHEQRNVFESHMREQGFSGFEIRDRGTQNDLNPASSHAEYAVIHLIEPLPSNIRALGLNVNSFAPARAALSKAKATLSPTLTIPFDLTQNIEKALGVVLYMPVNRSDGQITEAAFVAIGIRDFINSIVSAAPLPGMDICIYDELLPSTDSALITHSSCDKSSAVYYSERVSVGGRQWLVKFVPNSDYPTTMMSVRNTPFQVGAIIVSYFFMAFVLLSVGHRRRIEALVEERTQDLEATSEQLHLLAYYDQLTGLPNQARMAEHAPTVIERCRKQNQIVAVFAINLDKFKRLNDSLGYATCDKLLTLISERFAHALRNTDDIGRFGGDEFIALISHLDAPEQVEIVARKLLHSLHKPFLLADLEIPVSASIGIALCPGHATEFEQLMIQADIALGKAKESGGNSWNVYSGEKGGATSESLKLQNQLKQALEREEFVLHFQPQVSAQYELKGLEALVRWQHPERGLVYPGEFIHLLEDLGLIQYLGEWVIRSSMQQIVQWRRSGFSRVCVAVNISALQFLRPGFVALLERLLAETGADAQQMELEITEGALLQFNEHVESQIHAIKALGFSLALDDFGTGYSCLSYLKRLPLDKLKIDRSFVKDLPEDNDDAAIVNATILMAKQLKLEVVAEGVETFTQWQYLVERQCDTIQGYVVAKPMPADDVIVFIQGKETQYSALLKGTVS